MLIVPATPLGEVATQEVVELQLNPVTMVEPNLEVVEPTTKPVPVTLTAVPPASGPADGLTAEIIGIASNMNRSAPLAADVPPGVETVTSNEPAT
jgi:hypothetical protein